MSGVLDQHDASRRPRSGFSAGGEQTLLPCRLMALRPGAHIDMPFSADQQRQGRRLVVPS